MSAPMKLVLMNPVPSDIEVSQSIKTIPIGEVAEAVGVLPGEYDLYGKNKLKVALEVRDRLKDRCVAAHESLSAICLCRCCLRNLNT